LIKDLKGGLACFFFLKDGKHREHQDNNQEKKSVKYLTGI